MLEIEPRVGVGPLRLLMSREDVFAILGAPESLYDPYADEIFDSSEKKFFVDQVVEIRKKDKIVGLWDLIFEKDRLVCINMRGDNNNLAIDGEVVSIPRMNILTHVQSFDQDVWIRSENYAFMGTGLCLSRAKNRKDINYVRLYDIAFKARRLEFELYKRHVGPIIP